MAEGPAASRGGARAVLLALLILILAAAGGGYLWLGQEFQAAGPGRSVQRLKVEPGASLRGVLTQLEKGGSLQSARAVEWYLRVHGLRPRVQAGVYDIAAQASPAQILEQFAEGRVVLEQLTVVEGATFADFLSQLAQHPEVTHTLSGKTAAQIMAALGHAGQAPEGEFFPDTYRFAAQTADLSILGLAYDSMQRALAAAWRERDANLPFDSAYQVLILASIIEKEAALKSERPLIAGVFINRLRKGMRLQSDPTVIYGLGGEYDGTIHTRDLQRDTPYNTYTREGLPPTPVALPGRESLQATVHPAKTPALYFVATGLNDGAHHFSSTLEEHNAAVQTYLARLRNPPHAPAKAAPANSGIPSSDAGHGQP